jgi:hypothetical protein
VSNPELSETTKTPYRVYIGQLMIKYTEETLENIVEKTGSGNNRKHSTKVEIVATE